MKNIGFITIISIIGLVGLVVHAQTLELITQTETARCGPQPTGEYILCEQIPGFPTRFGGVADFIGALFRYSLMIGGIVVFLRIIYGGLTYIFSGGNPAKQNDARDVIWQAIWGLALLLGSYLILNTINPELVTLRELPSAIDAGRLEIQKGGIDPVEKYHADRLAYEESREQLNSHLNDEIVERYRLGLPISEEERNKFNEQVAAARARARELGQHLDPHELGLSGGEFSIDQVESIAKRDLTPAERERVEALRDRELTFEENILKLEAEKTEQGRLRIAEQMDRDRYEELSKKDISGQITELNAKMGWLEYLRYHNYGTRPTSLNDAEFNKLNRLYQERGDLKAAEANIKYLWGQRRPAP